MSIATTNEQTGRLLPPSPAVMGIDRWQVELSALRDKGATLLQAGPARTTAVQAPVSAQLLTLRWPISPPPGKAARCRSLVLRVAFHETYPWLPARVAVPRRHRPTWLQRHCNLLTGQLCLTGHLAPGTDGTWRSIDRDPTELLASLLSRQLPRIIEANTTGHGVSGSGTTQLSVLSPGAASPLEDLVPEGLATWLVTYEPYLLLDFSSFDLDTPPDTHTAASVRPTLAAVRHLTGGSPLHWLGCRAAITRTDGGSSMSVSLPAALLHGTPGRSGRETVNVGDVLHLRIAFVPVVAIDLEVGPRTEPEDLWHTGAARLAFVEDPQQELLGSISRLTGRPGTIQALIVLVPDENTHRNRGRTPLLLIRTRQDKRHRWQTFLGSTFDTSPAALSARLPHEATTSGSPNPPAVDS